MWSDNARDNVIIVGIWIVGLATIASWAYVLTHFIIKFW